MAKVNSISFAQHYRENSSLQYSLAQEALECMKLTGEESILDVGCGDGRITAELSQQVPRGKVKGIDPSASMIDLALRSFPKNNYPNLSFAMVSAEEMGIEEPVDLVIVLNALHWVRDPKKAIANCTATLKPGGTLYILTFPRESTYYKFLEKTLEQEEWSRFSSLSAKSTILPALEYKALIEKCGFTIDTFSLEKKIATYHSKEHLMAYIKGWLPCYLPLPSLLEEAFLHSAAANALFFSLSKEEIQLPYYRLIIKATLNILA